MPKKIKKAEVSEYSVKYLRNWGWKASVYAGFRRAERKWNKPVQGIDTFTGTFVPPTAILSGNGTSPFRALTRFLLGLLGSFICNSFLFGLFGSFIFSVEMKQARSGHWHNLSSVPWTSGQGVEIKGICSRHFIKWDMFLDLC